MRAAVSSALLLLSGVSSAQPQAAHEPAQVLADGRDSYSLLYQHPINRQLFEQLNAEGQDFRLTKAEPYFTWLADASIGSQQVISAPDQTRFHGFYVLDGYAALRPVEGLDLNLNLALFNPSASDGFRSSSSVSAGAALHFYYDLPLAKNENLESDLLGIDLGPTTLGNGLLLEQTPLEGVLINLAYREFYFRHVFGGRVFWDDDDLFAFHLGAFDGLLELQATRWQFNEAPAANYVGVASQWPLLGQPLQPAHTLLPKASVPTSAQLALEYLSNLRDGGVRDDATSQEPATRGIQWRHAALARTDFLTSFAPGLNAHLGYQFRFYQQGFGPRNRLQNATTLYNLPFREDDYVTNSFEYFAVSPLFDQWSHTLMAELQVPLGRHFKLVGEAEYWLRFAADPNSPEQFLSIDGFDMPGSFGKVYYQAGLELFPWPNLPHRLGAKLTNKQVSSQFFLTTTPVRRRFDRGHWVLFSAEAFL